MTDQSVKEGEPILSQDLPEVDLYSFVKNTWPSELLLRQGRRTIEKVLGGAEDEILEGIIDHLIVMSSDLHDIRVYLYKRYLEVQNGKDS